MKTASIATVLAVLVLVMSGCACGPGGSCGGGSIDSGGGCADGSCGATGLLGSLGGGHGSGILGGGKGGGMLGGVRGTIAEHRMKNHRGPQAHYGPTPGPANGPPAPTVTYPYYTTRGPRDFLAAKPPSIGP